jgi:HD-GYP domain-containing protein (c-di-GMP phosphodiesterase class II)
MQTYKGWFFVFVTSALLYNTILREFRVHWEYERELENIANFSKEIRGILDPHELAKKILYHLRSLFKADIVYLGQPDNVHRSIKMTFLTRIEDEIVIQYLPYEDSLAAAIYSERNTITNNYPMPEEWNDSIFSGEGGSFAAAPLISIGLVRGLIGFARKVNLRSSDIHLLNAVAEITGQALYAAKLVQDNQTQIQRLSTLRKIDDTILSNLDTKNLLDLLLVDFTSSLGVDGAAITIYNPNPDQENVYINYGTVEPDDNYPAESAGYAASCTNVLVIQNAKKGIHSQRTYPAHHPIQDLNMVGYAVSPLKNRDIQLGIIEILSKKELLWDREQIEFFEVLTNQLAIAIDKLNMVSNLRQSNENLMLAYQQTLEGWSRAMDLRDHETENHTQRVTSLTVKLAQCAGFSGEELLQVRRGALLHDIGKLGVPDEILLKAGSLTEEEWKIMRQHPEQARSLIEPISYLRPAMNIPFYHHEKWDGSGYPQQLRGEEIPIEARIFSVVDVWDALTSDRPYRQALTPEVTARYIREQSGYHFDPHIVELFLDLLVTENYISASERYQIN